MNNSSRRNFIGNISKLTVLGAIGASTPMTTAAINSLRDEEFGFATPPYLQNVTDRTIDILFITKENAYSWIEYGENDLEHKAQAVADGFVQANNRLNSIKLSNLKPGTLYKYRVVSRPIKNFDPYDLEFGDEVISDVHEFKTLNPEVQSVSCLILNDIHDRPSSFKELFSVNNGFSFDFVALNGDMFDYQTDEQQIINNLLIPCTNLFASNVPFIMIRGNHETRGKYAREFKDYFSFEEDEYFFSFKRGPVHWVILDSGEDKTDDDPEYGGIVDFDRFRERQAEWLKVEMKKEAFQDCSYRVVLMHIAPFHSGDWHGTMHCRKLFHPIFEEHKVDMVVSGHTHRIGIHPPDEDHNYPIIIGGGPKKGNRTIIQLRADQKKLELNMKKDNGELVGTYVL